MGFLANYSHADCTGSPHGVNGHLQLPNWIRKSTMGFLAICSHANGSWESDIGFLAICSHADCSGESDMGFLCMYSHAHCTGQSPRGYWPSAATRLNQEVRNGVPGHL